SDSLKGTWELSVDVGGWSGVHNHKPGNDTLVVFTGTSYSFLQKGVLVRSGTYQTQKDTIFRDHTLGNRIIFDGQDAGYPHEFFTIRNNQLTLFIDAFDAGSTTYRRIK
ncbi:MAG: hypothetical protein JST32_16435, partial [Bacteroidetes bacterium]|nr:hypothetical protein [Bacteroidota bacterium]